jgi:Enoyl-(Acyl carrier protein) reductase
MRKHVRRLAPARKDGIPRTGSMAKSISQFRSSQVFRSLILAKAWMIRYGWKPFRLFHKKVFVEPTMRETGGRKALANELRGRNITINAVAPGPLATEVFLTGKAEAQIEHLRKLPPLERLGQPEDIANLVSFIHGRAGI